MVIGVLWALLAGLMLGLYALPAKYTKDFKFENTWGLFFLLTMFVVPMVATFAVMTGVAEVYWQVDRSKLAVMVVASFLWGTGVMMWGKAINHIGVSLGFSLFIGTVILVGSLLPFFVDGLPNTAAFLTIMIGILVVLAGVYSNGKAGMTRERDEAATPTEAEQTETERTETRQTEEPTSRESAEPETPKSMAAGIAIAVIGGLLATGFSLANAVGRPQIHEASQAWGNPEWVTAVAVMLPIFLSGGVVMTVYFVWQLTQKSEWQSFKTPHFAANLVLIFIMAFFHYTASAVFAYAAFKLGDFGNTVGYAIFNTASVFVAVVSGIVTGEWIKASPAAKGWLYKGLGCMVLGIVIIAIGNALAAGPSQAGQADPASVQNIEHQQD